MRNAAGENDQVSAYVRGEFVAQLRRERAIANEKEFQAAGLWTFLEQGTDGAPEDRDAVPVAEGASETNDEVVLAKSKLETKLGAAAVRVEPRRIDGVGIHHNARRGNARLDELLLQGVRNDDDQGSRANRQVFA